MADEQTDTPDPAVTRVLHALAAEQHADLCNCDAYPDRCLSTSRYDQDGMLANLTYAEPALTEARKQGWMLPAEITGDAVKDVTNAIEQAFLWDPNDVDFEREARAAITAHRRHLTAERDAETTALHESLRDLMTALGLDPDTVTETDDAIRHATALRAELEEAESRLAQIWGLVQKTANRGDDLPADANEQVLDLTDWNSATLPAVLADPAPSTPAAQENQT